MLNNHFKGLSEVENIKNISTIRKELKEFVSENFKLSKNFRRQNYAKFNDLNAITPGATCFGMINEGLFFEVSIGKFMDIIIYGITFSDDSIKSKAVFSIQEVKDYLNEMKKCALKIRDLNFNKEENAYFIESTDLQASYEDVAFRVALELAKKREVKIEKSYIEEVHKRLVGVGMDVVIIKNKIMWR
ncbi:MAG: hypothetical protein M0P94_05310 [Candidatus Absconditabacterales bacterium]|nr:hypothetical protein [Candidatus Absconditabacterales bacterium]